MKPDTTGHLLADTPPPSVPAVGCATCWAAKYCAAFAPDGLQPPPACPLVPKPKRKAKPRPTPKRLLHSPTGK